MDAMTLARSAARVGGNASFSARADTEAATASSLAEAHIEGKHVSRRRARWDRRAVTIYLATTGFYFEPFRAARVWRWLAGSRRVYTRVGHGLSV